MTPRPVPVLIVAGTVGVGKTSVGYAASHILSTHEMPHAFVDKDGLCVSWPPQGRFNDDMAFRNLASMWRNFADAGAERLISAGVVEERADLDRYREAIPGALITVCWVRASQAAREARLRGRDEGESLAWHLARTVELEAIVEAARVHDFEVWNEDRPMLDTAQEVLVKARWIDDRPERRRGRHR
ncbi:MAG: hypothetical protein WD826_01025 [Actinomycetota bacterium]